jgi:zinc protease
MDHALYPVGHPYHHATIGSHEDLSAATLEDVRGFFRQYYVPKNAALSMVGDFQSSEMKALVEKYFGDMQAGDRALTPNPPRPTITSPKHWVIEDDIALPRVYFAWLTPALFEAGDAELDLLSSVLSRGKSSRLFHALVYKRKLAKDIHAFQMSQKLNGVYVIQATAAPGTDLKELAAAVEEELSAALKHPPTESELNRARNDYKKNFFDQLQTFSDRASLLGTYFLHTGQGDYVKEDYARYLNAGADAVLAAGKKYLHFNKAVRLDFVPGKKDAPVRKLELEKAEGGAQ